MEPTQHKDLSFSVWINEKPVTRHGFDGIQRRTRLKWEEDASVTCCYKCKVEFGWFVRRSHCRYDGRIYCGKCTSRRAVIPLDVPIPEPTFGNYDNRNPDEPLRVCDACFVKLNQIRRTHDCPTEWKNYKAFIEYVLDVRDLKAVSLVCKEWNKIANYHLSRFFELQYHLPGRPYKDWQRDMLWANRNHFPGHSKWMVQFVRSIQYQTTEGLSRLDELRDLIQKHIAGTSAPLYPKAHWNLMCSRYCCQQFSLGQIITMLDENVPNEGVRQLLVTQIDSKNEDFVDYIGYLVHHMSTADCAINQSVIGSWLLSQGKDDLTLANEIYWEMHIRTGCQKQRNRNMYRYWLEKWIESMPSDIVNTVLLSKTFADGCANVGIIPTTSARRLSSSSSKRGIADAQPAPNNVQAFFRRTDEVVSPTHITQPPTTIKLDGVKVLQSITKPILIPFNTLDDTVFSILFKGEDIRKDQTAMSFIRLCDKILKRELHKDFNIVTYPVRPTMVNGGFIKIVNECTTLYDMDTRACNMFNFVTGDSKIEDLRERFMRSCAAYSTLTYLLGAGDRHLHNIMLTKDARLFHIDYGYVMGADPKKIIGLTKVPDMRIDQNIVNLLGPPENFQRFENMVDEIYNCLRRHVEPLTALLRTLILSDPPIHVQSNFTEKRLMKEVITRFAPGENHEQARIQIINVIENSTRSTTHYAIVDSLHHQAQTNGLIRAIASGWHGIKSFF
jgi:hypothetical protein